MGFEFLDHTADLRIRVWGKDLTELFEEAAFALFSVITDIETVEPKIEEKVEVEAEDQDELLVGWLSELLYLHEVKGLLFSKFKVLWFQKKHMSAKVWGEPFSPERHSILLPVKAVTYHRLKIEQQGGFWVTEIIFDV